jgi:tyrosine-specific transport protein
MENTLVTKGKIVGSALLVAGNCIGAGMLALPIFTGLGGFIPSLCMFLFSWLFMTLTGLLLLEVNLSLHIGASLVSMAHRTFGKAGKIFCWILWCFLFYSLLVAYISGGGSTFKDLFSELFGFDVPMPISNFIFVLLFGILTYLGTNYVDIINRYFMIGLILTYVLLIVFGFKHIKSDFLLRQNWGYTLISLPILIISFGFHNIVPSLVPYLNGRVSLLKKTIFIGSLLPLFIYALFELVILGIVPVEGSGSIKSALDQGLSSTDVLQNILSNSLIGSIAAFFAFFALTTSFLAVALSFVHFFKDAFKVKTKKNSEPLSLTLLVLLPPFIITLIDPSLFLKALNLAGGIGAVLLFGILPCLMAWKCRYTLQETKRILVYGGKPVLIMVIIFSLFILSLSIREIF